MPNARDLVVPQACQFASRLQAGFIHRQNFIDKHSGGQKAIALLLPPLRFAEWAGRCTWHLDGQGLWCWCCQTLQRYELLVDKREFGINACLTLQCFQDALHAAPDLPG